MNAEERTLAAIEVARCFLRRALYDPVILILMAANDISPDDVEDVVTEILEYLEKTAEEDVSHG
jgi:hypothetical protein